LFGMVTNHKEADCSVIRYQSLSDWLPSVQDETPAVAVTAADFEAKLTHADVLLVEEVRLRTQTQCFGLTGLREPEALRQSETLRQPERHTMEDPRGSSIFVPLRRYPRGSSIFHDNDILTSAKTYTFSYFPAYAVFRVDGTRVVHLPTRTERTRVGAPSI
jgi:hypothetical protein